MPVRVDHTVPQYSRGLGFGNFKDILMKNSHSYNFQNDFRSSISITRITMKHYKLGRDVLFSDRRQDRVRD